MREYLEALLNALLPFAEQMLKKNGEFYPFGATVSQNGEVAMIAADLGKERPSSSEVMNTLTAGFVISAQRGEILACGICYNAGVKDPQSGKPKDAVVLDLESPGEVARLAIPFKKKFLRGYAFESILRLPLDAVVFR